MSKPNVNINRILVVGAGAMGSQIAMVCALGGYQVSLQDISDAMLDKAGQQLEERLARNVEKGRLSADDKVAAFSHLSFTTDLSVAKSADFVIEAVIEKLDIKRQLFAELDRLAPEHAILATNSSSFVSSQIANATTSGSGSRPWTCRVMSVRMLPGDTSDTETPLPASCRRNASENPRRPYLVAARRCH